MSSKRTYSEGDDYKLTLTKQNDGRWCVVEQREGIYPHSAYVGFDGEIKFLELVNTRRKGNKNFVLR